MQIAGNMAAGLHNKSDIIMVISVCDAMLCSQACIPSSVFNEI